MGWVNESLSQGFYYLGERIAQYPKYFSFIFLIISLALSTGLLRFKYENDVEYIFSVIDGDSLHEREIVEKYFPPNNNHRFNPSRATRLNSVLRVIITEKNEEDILRETIWKEIKDLDHELHQVSTEWKNVHYNYSTLCAKWFGDCFENYFLEIGDVIPDFESGKARINYPIFFHPTSFKSHVLPQYFGGIKLSKDGFSLESAKAIILTYIIAVDNEEENRRGEMWESAVLRALLSRNVNSNSSIQVYQLAYKSLSEETEKNVISCLLPLLCSAMLTVVYIVFTCSSLDWVTSKPFVGLMGCVSAILGILAAFGGLCYFQVPIIAIDIAIPFILLGIGIDDTFVMLSAWRLTSPHASVPKRLAECYAESAVSVTITTCTDSISFLVGVYFTPIRAIQLFSAYIAAGVLCIYIWQIFFFGSILALSGYMEAQNRHAVVFCVQTTPKSKSGTKPSFYRYFCTGGINETDPFNPKDTSKNATMVFFRDKFSPFLCKGPVKLTVLILFVLYWVVSYYGIQQLQEGLEERRISRDDSYINGFYLKDSEYFRVYPYRVQVVITTPLDYSLKQTQERVFEALKKVIAHPNTAEEFSENWLRSFNTYLETYAEFLEFNVTNEETFIKILRENYLKETSVFSQDIIFNKDKSRIIASRFILQVKDLWDAETAKIYVGEARKIAADMIHDGLNVTIFNPWFVFVDQFIIIHDLTVKLFGITVVIVLVVCTILIPSFICSVCVLFSICSIQMGVLGFMSLWGVNLDFISVIGILMCIGFSVDFSAHVSYSYISSTAESPQERIKDSLYFLGLPVVQGAISTLLSILTLMLVPSYIFQSIFKIIALVIIFAMFHSLFLLPILFLIFTPFASYLLKVLKMFSFQNRKPKPPLTIDWTT